jgi:hypothetical protein
MQHDLHHRELVEVGVEQALNDHGAVRWRGGVADVSPGLLVSY